MSGRFTVALAGNPNSGKTSVFNALTGSNQRVGNWPGVTVEKKEGKFYKDGMEIKIVDLPGIYSLTADSIDQKIAVDFLIHERPDLVICVIDSSNFERNMYLLTQLIEMGQKLVVALNMSDIAEKDGILIDEKKLSMILNCPVVKTVAVKKIGIEELKAILVDELRNSSYRRKSEPLVTYPNAIETSLTKIMEKIKTYQTKEINLRWLSINLFLGDMSLLKILNLKDEGIRREIEKIVLQETIDLQKSLGEDIDILIANSKYSKIREIYNSVALRKSDTKASVSLTAKLDRLIINKYLGIPIFLAIMYIIFTLVFSVGGFLADFIDSGMTNFGEFLTRNLESINTSSTLISFLVDGVIGGVGSVLVFLPNIVILYLLIGLLEDIGYMARAAFVMDRIMQFLGLPGKSFIPLLLGFGCNVPAIMATRTLDSEKDRILTILITPLMSCSARLPIYVLFASVFFQKHQALVVFSMYVIGIVVAIAVGKFFSATFFNSTVSPLIMELPIYRLPRLGYVLLRVWQRSSMFLKKAGTIIFSVVVLVWLLSSLPFGVEYASEKSVIGYIGKLVEPILKLPGFGFWQAGVALVFGFLAKEVVVGTLGTLFGGEDALRTVLAGYFTPLSAYSFMLFSLIYVPCAATVAIIRQEAGKKWAWFTVFYTTFLAWLISTLVYQIGKFFA
ncbi:MAG: ferrous iron transport protein [Pseudothermotoga sp.]|nr:ferrous iron transport protein [Pseudothermotoga sp.]